MKLEKLHKRLINKAYSSRTSRELQSAIAGSVSYIVDGVATTMQERMDVINEAIKNTQLKK